MKYFVRQIDTDHFFWEDATYKKSKVVTVSKLDYYSRTQLFVDYGCSFNFSLEQWLGTTAPQAVLKCSPKNLQFTICYSKKWSLALDMSKLMRLGSPNRIDDDSDSKAIYINRWISSIRYKLLESETTISNSI